MELAKDPFGVFALIMTPTRELAIQISEQFRALSAGMSFKVNYALVSVPFLHPDLIFRTELYFSHPFPFQDCVVIGGVDMQKQARELSRRPHVVISTPGRLKVPYDGSLCDALCV